MPTLELFIDATGMQRGAQQAEQSLKSVEGAATKTATSVQATSTALTKTFQATQGGVQIATGIAQTATAFQSLNTAAAGFVGARTLLEIGQTATQLAALRTGAGAASGAFLALGRAIPYVGLALSVATAAYAIFGGRVKDTTQKVNEQTDALGRLQSKIRETEIRAAYGQPDQRNTVGSTVDTLVALRGGDREMFTAKDAAGLFGVSEQELRYALARSGLGEAALEFGPGRANHPAYNNNPSARFQMQSFTRGQVIGAGEDILAQRRGPSPVTTSANGPWEVEQARRMSSSWASAENASIDAARQREEDRARAIEESLGRAAAYAGQIGASLGAAVFDVAAGITSWRQALASLISSVARGGLSDLGSSLASSLFRSTPAQGGGGGRGNLVLPEVK